MAFQWKLTVHRPRETCNYAHLATVWQHWRRFNEVESLYIYMRISQQNLLRLRTRTYSSCCPFAPPSWSLNTTFDDLRRHDNVSIRKGKQIEREKDRERRKREEEKASAAKCHNWFTSIDFGTECLTTRSEKDFLMLNRFWQVKYNKLITSRHQHLGQVNKKCITK